LHAGLVQQETSHLHRVIAHGEKERVLSPSIDGVEVKAPMRQALNLGHVIVLHGREEVLKGAGPCREEGRQA